MSHQIPISVADVDQLLVAGFTHIEIWKSEDFGNSYLPLAKTAAEPPVLDSLPALTTFAVGGRSLVLDFSGSPVTFTFDPTFLRWTAPADGGSDEPGPSWVRRRRRSGG